MKKIIALTASILSTSSMANWDINQNGVAWQIAQQDLNHAAILEHSNGKLAVSVVSTLQDACKGMEGAQVAWLVNNTPVKFEIFCSQGATRSYPATDKGRKFVIEEFKEKSKVKIGSYAYSAVGFTKAIEKVKEHDEITKNAI